MIIFCFVLFELIIAIEKFRGKGDRNLFILLHFHHFHHKVVLRCNKCGKQFISEKERLHQVREPCKNE